jgi:murein DD-endopeptidase MepM/ murein hydrolase activator NlpD
MWLNYGWKEGVLYKVSESRGFGKFVLIIILPFLILAGAYFLYNLLFIPDPVISDLNEFKYLPAKKRITLNFSSVSYLNIVAFQDEKRIPVIEKKPEMREGSIDIDIVPSDLGLRDGRTVILVKVRSGLFKEKKHQIVATVDTIAPTLEIIRAPSAIFEGSAGVVLLRAKGADRVYVKLEDYRFKAFNIHREGLSREGIDTAKTYVVLIPAPYGIKDGNIYYAVAEDVAGNQTVQRLSTRFKFKKYKSSRINLSDDFINSIIMPMINEEIDPVSAFKLVNEEWRRESHERILKIAEKTEPSVLWEGRFLQLRNSKVMATYGDERTYVYNGQEISMSVHLGYDLASVANAPVEAANSGIVRYAGDLGIYGNTIIIDHGLGLMSLYGHLSMIDVKVGDPVKKGDIIGRTGSTGLAGGDHLHFGILVHGFEISPLYWWDRRWIEVNIDRYLRYPYS